MERPANINFLTPEENQCFELLLQAQDIFDEICKESPQSPGDSYNFGHYLEAARGSLLIRGARRMDADNLIRKTSATPKMTPTMLEHLMSTERRTNKISESIADDLKLLKAGESGGDTEKRD